MFGEAELQEKCLQLIDEYASDTIKSQGFTQMTRHTLEIIMKRDTLDLDELDVYKGCIRWANSECGRQHIEVCNGYSWQHLLKHLATNICSPFQSIADTRPKLTSSLWWILCQVEILISLCPKE